MKSNLINLTPKEKLADAIEELMQKPNLAPETLELLKMAAESHKTGKMPPLAPIYFHDCTATAGGVGKITVPHRVG